MSIYSIIFFFFAYTLAVAFYHKTYRDQRAEIKKLKALNKDLNIISAATTNVMNDLISEEIMKAEMNIKDQASMFGISLDDPRLFSVTESPYVEQVNQKYHMINLSTILVCERILNELKTEQLGNAALFDLDQGDMVDQINNYFNSENSNEELFKERNNNI
jgi:hypothetical protein